MLSLKLEGEIEIPNEMEPIIPFDCILFHFLLNNSNNQT